MTSGKAVQLKKVADAVACAKCQTNPRFGSLQRCKQCLRADAEAERIARERLPPPQSATMSNRQQAGTARAAGRKPRATLSASKALTVVRPDPRAVVPSIVAEPVRELGRPYSITEWQARITQALKWFRVAKAEVQSRMVEESQAAKMIAANTQHARITYGSSPLVTLQPRSNVGLSFVHLGSGARGCADRSRRPVRGHHRHQNGLPVLRCQGEAAL
jgi:hypothetical protein